MRPTLAHIDLVALQQNYHTLRNLHGGSLFAVLKANAYGHGALDCAQALPQADGFAVAFFDEALVLRRAGVRQPIAVLEGVFDTNELALASLYELAITVHSSHQLEMLEQARLTKPLTVWLKINSGMNRAGFDAAQAQAIYPRLRALANVHEVVLMTHFARADEHQNQSTTKALARFEKATDGLVGTRSMANSAAVLAWPQTRSGIARSGIALYGINPLDDEHNSTPLQAVMTLESRIFAVRQVARGESVGYGTHWHAPRDTRVGLVAIGYADGYPRSAPNGTPMAVDGQPAQLVGRISMDMLSVDLSALPAAGIGSRVELWGKTVALNEVARLAGTISYELLCNVKRMPRKYQYPPLAAD